MSAHYELLGLEGPGHSPPLRDNPSHYKFRAQLRDTESGVVDLNLAVQSVHLATEIAAFDLNLDSEQRIALILLIIISLAALEEGSTRFPVTGPESIEPMRRLLAPLCGSSFGDEAIERMRGAIELLLTSSEASAVIGSNSNDYKPLLYSPPYMYQHRSFSAEVKCARQLASLATRRPLPASSPPFSSAAQTGLSNEQIAAVERAVAGPITIISGGPGTGKTSIIIEIVKALIAGGVEASKVALAAPTGKAAYRIGESMRRAFTTNADTLAPLKGCPEPSTLHRLLGYSLTTRRFRYHHNNPLGAEAVIIDEASMVDLELMSHLLDALRTGSRLILLGDADQLPSVSAGAVFRDLLPTNESAPLAGNCVRLTRSYRVAVTDNDSTAILSVANAIKTGTSIVSNDNHNVPLVLRESVEQIRFTGVEWLYSKNDAAEFLKYWYDEHIASNEISNAEKRVFDSVNSGFDPAECEAIRQMFFKLSNSRILCATRVLQEGSGRLNELLHWRRAREVGVRAGAARFIAGEPVMVLRNDYERMLFNGDQGVVLRVRRSGAEPVRMAVFPRADNFVAFSLDALKDQLELSYAMTVHKAQGSEFDAVALILPEKDLPILSRELLYTAVSRARRSVTIVGSKEVLEAAVSRKIERYSGVRERLAECLREGLRA